MIGSTIINMLIEVDCQLHAMVKEPVANDGIFQWLVGRLLYLMITRLDFTQVMGVEC